MKPGHAVCKGSSAVRMVAGLWWAGLLAVLLSACGSSRPAPVVEIGQEPRFLDTGRMHRVNDGETLYAVAWMYDLDFVDLARVNNLREPYALATGQMLRVDVRSTPQVATNQSRQAVQEGVRVNPVQVGGGISRAPLGGGLQRSPLPSAESLPPEPPAPSAPESRSPAGLATESLPEPVPEPVTPTVDVPEPVAPVTPPQVAVVVPPEPMPEPVPAPAVPAADTPIRWDWPSRGRLIGRYSETDIDNKGLKFEGKRGDPVRAAADGQVVYAGRGLLRYGDLIILKHNDRFLSAYAHNDRILVQEGAFVTQGEQIAELGSSGIDREMLHFEIRVEGQPVDPMQFLPQR